MGGDDGEEEQWGYGYRDVMIAEFNQFSNRNFSFQDQGKCDENDTLQNRSNFWLNVIDIRLQYLIMFMIMIIATLE